MKKVGSIILIISRIATLAILMAVAWVLSGVQALFHSNETKPLTSVSPLFKMNKAHADVPGPGDSGGGGGDSGGADSGGDSGDGGY